MPHLLLSLLFSCLSHALRRLLLHLIFFFFLRFSSFKSISNNVHRAPHNIYTYFYVNIMSLKFNVFHTFSWNIVFVPFDFSKIEINSHVQLRGPKFLVQMQRARSFIWQSYDWLMLCIPVVFAMVNETFLQFQKLQFMLWLSVVVFVPLNQNARF